MGSSSLAAKRDGERGTGEQFVRGDGGGAQFADHHTGGVVGKKSGFDRRRARHDGQGEGGNDGVARAGDIEDFARGGGDMEWLFVALAEEETLLAEGNKEQGGLKVSQELLRHPPQALVAGRLGAVVLVGKTGQFKGFLAIGGEEGKAGQIQRMGRLGVHAQPDAAGAAQPPGLLQQRLRDDAFGVVAKNQGVGVLQGIGQHGE